MKYPLQPYQVPQTAPLSFAFTSHGSLSILFILVFH